jgi:hypothetical protein
MIDFITTVGTTVITFFTMKILEKAWDNRHKLRKELGKPKRHVITQFELDNMPKIVKAKK